MKFEDYLAKAPKLVEFIRNGKLLDSIYRANDDRVMVIYSPQEAYRLMCDDETDDYECWRGLTEVEYTTLQFEFPCRWYSRQEALVSPIKERFNDKELESEIPNLWDDFDALMRYCISNKNLNNPSELFNMIELAYINGGIPCGWKGKYPDGKLVVFSRKE
jgi:hypothetical protein